MPVTSAATAAPRAPCTSRGGPRRTAGDVNERTTDRTGTARNATATRTPARPAREKKTLCGRRRSEAHTSELQSRENLVCRLLLEKKKAMEVGTHGPAL